MKRLLRFAPIFILFINQFSFSIAQENSQKRLTPSQRREQLREAKVYDDILKYNVDTTIVDIKIPERWKNESAIILYINSSYSYIREDQNMVGGIKVTELVQKKIKLMDNAAVNEFSKIYFYTLSDYRYNTNDFGLKVIKPDGKIIDVNANEAVKIETNIPYLFRAYYYQIDLQYKKLAVPNLQVGDIIEYYIKSVRSAGAGTEEVDFTPFIFTLNSSYPILKQEFNFSVDRGFYINFSAYNNAPQLTEGTIGLDMIGRQRALIKTYKLVDFERDKTTQDIWSYPRLRNPYVKFQVFYETRSMSKVSKNFLGEMGKVKSNISVEDIQQVITRRIEGCSHEIQKKMTVKIKKYLNDFYPKETNTKKISDLIYYYLRFLATDMYYNPEIYFSDIQKPQLSEPFSIDENLFVSVMIEALANKKIKSEVIVAVPRYKGSLNNILLSDDYNLGIRVDGSENSIYFPFGNHSTPKYCDFNFEGTEAYYYIPVKNKRLSIPQKIVIPQNSFNSNNYNSSSEVSIDNTFDLVKINRKNSLTGYCKSDEAFTLLSDYDYMELDLKKYDPKRYEKLLKEEANPKASKEKLEELRKKMTAKEDRKTKHFEQRKKELDTEFDDVASFDSFEVLEDGRDNDTNKLIFSEEITLKNLVNKAGRNYSLDIGKLIGKQIELKETDMKRSNDISISYAKTINDEIILILPAGYIAEGLTDLNVSIDNESAAFTSFAKQDGNRLIIKTTKIYKKSFDKKENWQKWVDVLEASYKFSQKKVILKMG